MAVKFQKTVRKGVLLSPLKGFDPDTRTYEYRFDPLTGRSTTIAVGTFEYVKKFLVTDGAMLKALIEKTRPICPFCPESLEKLTPKFPSDLVSDGRIRVGEAVAFPSLFGHAEHSIVVVLTGEHYLNLDAFKPELLENGFKGALSCLQEIAGKTQNVEHASILMNYLPPAGSSLPHPHIQLLAREHPFYSAKVLIEKADEYFKAYRSNYWDDLVEAERKVEERYLGKLGSVEWLLPFAPLHSLLEVRAIVPRKSNLLQLKDDDLKGLSDGVVRVLKFYFDQGVSSFNFALLSSSLRKRLESFSVNLTMNARTGIQPTCFSDAWALPYILQDGYSPELPETIAQKLKPYFG